MAITPSTSTSKPSTSTSSTGSTNKPGSALSGLGSSAPTHVDGLVSGIQSGQIIDALMASAGAATHVLVARQTALKNQAEAVRNLNTRLLTAQLDLSSLRQSSTFLSRTVAVGSPAVLDATASSSAAVGTYTVNVQQPAQAQQLSTGGFASATASLGTGPVKIGLGAAGAATITLDATNSSLNGLATAINSSGVGVKAQVINDGSSSKPWRLVLTSTRTGASNAISFEATGLAGGGSAGLAPVVTTARDASSTATVGLSGAFTGTNGPPQYLVQVDRGGTIGVDATFKWSKDGGATWTSGVAATTGAVALSDGVSVTFGAGTLTTADAFTVQPMQQLAAAQDAILKYGTGTSQISITSASNTVSNVIAGVTLNLKANGSTTITIGNDTATAKDGITTFVNDLNTAIKYLGDNSRYDATTGEAGVLIADAGLRSGVDRLINSLTRAATQAVATTSAIVGSPSGTVTIADGANELDVTVNGVAVKAKVAAGTYTLAQLADGLQTAINARFGGAGVVAVSASGNGLDLRSRGYGSAQSIVVQSTSTALAALGIAAGSHSGTDVAGNIDGVAGVGTGQVLAGAARSPAAGLQIVSTSTTPVPTVTMTLRRGLGGQAETAFKSLTDVSTGSVVSDEDALNSRVDDFSAQIAKQNVLLSRQRARLEAQFHQMESLIQRFNTQGSVMSQQIAGFQNIAATTPKG